MRALSLLLLALFALPSSAVADEGDAFDLHAALDAARSKTTAKERRQAALLLSRRPGLSTAQVIEAIWTLPPPAAPETGSSVVTARVEVDGAPTDVRVHLYVPESYNSEKAAPLLMAFHGTGGSGRSDVQSWSGVAEALGMIVVAPDDHGENVGYRFTTDERDAALGVLRWARLHFNVDAGRIHATGVSRGGHLTWDLALRHPDLFASIAPMIGGPRLSFVGGQNNTRYVANVARLPIRDLQGSRDDPRLLANLHFVFERLEALGAADAELIEFPELGHSFEYSAVDWNTFFGEARRPAWPERAVRAGARTTETRAFFVEITKYERGISPGFRPKVDPKKFQRLDEDGQRREVLRQIEKATAVLDVTRKAPFRYEATGRGVRAWRLLLPANEVDGETAVVVRWKGRTTKRRPKRDLAVLLTDWVERLDPGFLPVAELKL